MKLTLSQLTEPQKAFLQALLEHDVSMSGGFMTLPGGRTVSDAELAELLAQIRRGDDAETIRAEVERIANDFGHEGDYERAHGDIDTLMIRAMTAIAWWSYYGSDYDEAMAEIRGIAEAALATGEIQTARHAA